jgi:peptidoglycan/LPS O-acetylase OafA/YrhL
MGSATKQVTEFRADINGLRALAVATVVLFHFRVPGFSGGFVGVDVFFVISGFLMTKIIVTKLSNSTFSVLDFYLARARRIFPGLAVLCLAVLIMGGLSLAPLSYGPTAKHAASSLAFLSNFTFWSEIGYFDLNAAEKWLLHTWSLSVEWQFYLLYPLMLLAALRAFPAKGIFLLTIGVAFLLSLGVSIVVSPRNPEFAYFLLPARAWQMMAGGIAYLVTPYVKPVPFLSGLLELVGITLILFASTSFSAADPWPGYLAMVPVSGAVMVMLAQNSNSIFTTNRASSFIGNASYSIYLWHWPVAVAFTLRELHGSVGWVAGGIALTLGLGYVSYRWVEVPTRRLRARSRGREAFAYGSAAALLIGFALLVSISGGLPSRLGPNKDAYIATAAAIGDWTHPGGNCSRRGSLRYCESEGDADDVVMFIGDSIAEQWYPRYGEEASRHGPTVIFVTRPGCPPIRNTDGYPPGIHCGKNADAIWEIVRETMPQRLIISASWWATYFYPSGEMRGDACIMESSRCVPIRDVVQLRAAFEALEHDMAEAVGDGIQVFVIGPVPSAQVDYVDARLSRLASQSLPLALVKTWQDLPGFAEGRQSLDAGLKTLINRDTPRPAFKVDEDADSPTGVVTGVLRDIASRAGAELISPEKYLCSDGLCPLADEMGTPIYKDAMHLRAQYVRSGPLVWMDKLVEPHVIR